MLNPAQRSHLLELLRPPPGYRLDVAIGTTFSLDLLSALIVPLSFAFFDWEHADGRPVADPLALLEALRQYGDRFTVFCQAGQMRLPGEYPPLVTFLEPSIYEVLAPRDEGVFHPKVWAMRFTTDDDVVRYRVLCLSRNLTFDRSWDTVVALDGELVDRSNGIAANHPLGDFIAALPRLTTRRMAPERKTRIIKMAKELRRVRFQWPEGFDERQSRFWVGGLDGRVLDPFGERRDQSLIVSPFLSDAVIRHFSGGPGATHLVSRLESLQELPIETLRSCKSVHYLQPELTNETSDDTLPDSPKEALDGLHAKLFVIDHGWDASVFSGSFNATTHALGHNVEFMVEMVGRRSRCGVDHFLEQVQGETRFADLLHDFDTTIESQPPDPAARRLDEIFQTVKCSIAKASPALNVTASSENGLFDLKLTWGRPPQWPREVQAVSAWPITQHSERAQLCNTTIVFPRLSYAGLTALIAFAASGEVDGIKGQSVFVMNLPLSGAPQDRHERLLASLLAGKDQLLRYILFLLAAGDEATASSDELIRLLTDTPNGAGRPAHRLPCLLETMLRALHRDPKQLERVSSLLDALREVPDGSDLLSPEFESIWMPIWQIAQEDRK
jgi:hypothetical protein